MFQDMQCIMIIFSSMIFKGSVYKELTVSFVLSYTFKITNRYVHDSYESLSILIIPILHNASNGFEQFISSEPKEH